MARDRVAIGNCPHCGESTLECSHNRYQGEVRIDTWEHRCQNCGRRETRAFRSDEPDQPDDPLVCPWCGRRSQWSAS